MEPGHVGWHELHGDDVEQCWAFYSGLFGWTKGETKGETIDIGPMGVCQRFASGHAPVGGMMRRLPAMPAPFWLYYFSVESVEAAVKRAASAGGALAPGSARGAWRRLDRTILGSAGSDVRGRLDRKTERPSCQSLSEKGRRKTKRSPKAPLCCKA